jgi:hypothetical protein
MVIPETSAIFNQLILLTTQEDFVKTTSLQGNYFTDIALQ